MKVVKESFIYIIVVALCARLSFDIPLTDINITAQTLAITTLALVLSSKGSLLGISSYLLLGILGAPIFSEGNAGLDYFLGSSLGYFIGFVLATLFLCYIVRTVLLNGMTFINILMSCLLATLIILSSGTIGLAVKHSWTVALENGFYPFLLGGLIKSILSALLVMAIQTLKK